MTPILPGATIGILGNGQLGRMTAQAAIRMGYNVACYGPDVAPTPCGQAGAREVQGAYDDLVALAAFAQSVDVMTFEFENVSTAATDVAAEHIPVHPSGAVLHTTQDRIREKAALVDAGIPVAPYSVVHQVSDLEAGPFPGILKTAQSGYDGKGQRMVHNVSEATAALIAFGGVPCVLEGLVPFLWEGSVVGARNAAGDVALYPLVQNIHTHHILDTTLVPAPLASKELQASAAELAERILDSLDVIGVLCIEMFITANGIIVNELAPRPHNSGHWSIEGAVTSQFEQHVRAVCGLPLGSTELRAPAASMTNLLGDCWPEPDFVGALADPRVSLHLYGKQEARIGRKMGHLTAVGPTVDDAVQAVTAARTRLKAAE
jgi:5-(carboxyamino)imidazole ribonucleotide synthase